MSGANTTPHPMGGIMAAEIKAVLFDYGNVLCMPQLESDLEAMSACLNAPLAPVKSAYWNLRDQFDLGAINGAAYWSKIAEQCGLTPAEEQILRLIELDNIGWSRPNPIMAEWAARLRENGISTAIVSNMPSDIRQYLDTVEWLPGFDHYSYSCDLNSMKPDARIYEHTLQALNVEPRNALFIDDREVNVDAARQLGMHGFVFTDAEGLHSYIQSTHLPGLRLSALIV